jgi:hypothetical protein
MGYRASQDALTCLINAPDGDGTLNTVAASNDETTWQQVLNACDENGRDEFVSNTLVTSNEVWSHSLYAGAVSSTTSAGTGLCITTSLPAAGFDFKISNLDVLINNSPPLHLSMDVKDAAFTKCKSLVFDRKNALVSARKRWLELTNYSEPVRDLQNAIVTSRMDCATLYKDSICLITES